MPDPLVGLIIAVGVSGAHGVAHYIGSGYDRMRLRQRDVMIAGLTVFFGAFFAYWFATGGSINGLVEVIA